VALNTGDNQTAAHNGAAHGVALAHKRGNGEEEKTVMSVTHTSYGASRNRNGGK